MDFRSHSTPTRHRPQVKPADPTPVLRHRSGQPRRSLWVGRSTIVGAFCVALGLVSGLAPAAPTAATAPVAGTLAPSAPPTPGKPADLASATPVLDRLKRGEPLVIAHRESSVPFSFLDAKRQPTGYAVALCLKVADALRQQLGLKALPVQFRQVSGADRLQVIASGQADLECGSTTNNADRRKTVAFTVPHYITGARILVPAGSTLSELNQFAGKRLVSTQGTTPLKAIETANREHLLRIQVLVAPDHAKAMDMVTRGEADGFVMDDVLLYGLIAAQADPARFKVVGKVLTIEPLAIMLPKQDTAFKRLVDDEMKRLIREREAHALYERWFMQPIAPRNTALNLPMNHLLKDFWKYPTDVVPL